MATLKCKEILCLLYSTLLFFSGAILIGLSIVLAYKLLFYHYKFVPSVTIGPFIVVILLGIVHIAVTWLAIKGPSKEHDFHIFLFIGCCVLLFFIELAVGTWAMIMMSEVPSIIDESFEGFIKHGFDKSEWQYLQSKLECCGVNNISDYTDSIPQSCFYNNKQSFYKTGCKEPFTNFVKTVLMEIGLVAIFSGIFQCFGIAAFTVYYKALKEERTRRVNIRRQVSTISGGTMRRAPPPPPPVGISPP